MKVTELSHEDAGQLEHTIDARTPIPSAPLSILLVIPGYPPVLGGAEMHASRLAGALARRGHRVEVITTWDPRMPKAGRWADPDGIPVRAIGRSLPAAWRPRAFVMEVARSLLVHPRRYDVVHVFLPGLHVVSALVAGAITGVPGAVMFGGVHEIPRLHTSRFGRLQLRTIRGLARRVIVLNAPMKDDVMAFGVDAARIETHPCSVDPTDFAPVGPEQVASLRSRHGVPANVPVVLFTGRFVAEKALPTLLDAFALVRRSASDALLLLAGDGPLRESLEGRANQLGPGAVRFCGTLPPEGVRELLQLSDVFAFVSSSEGIPCSVIEAMSCARPAVVSEAPGVAQLIEDGVHGLVVAAGDVRGTADAIVRLMSDHALAARVGAAARQRVLESFSSDRVAANHELMYRAMRTSAPRRPSRLRA